VNHEIGWGLIGASRIAERWVGPAIRSVAGCRLAAVASSSIGRAESLAELLSIPRAYGAVDAVLADPDVDAVYVSSHNAMHAEQVVQAAKAGKHVLCEKPLALTVGDAQAMIEACQAARVVLATNHNKRQAPTLRTLRELVEAGEVGAPTAARVSFTTLLPEDLRSWRLGQHSDGGGVILDLAVHDVDALRFILGDEVEEVIAFASGAGTSSGCRAEDNSMALLRFKAGTLAVLHDSFTLPHSETAVEIHGSAGTILAVNCMGDTPGGNVYLKRAGHIDEISLGPRRNLYEATVEDFLQAIITGAPPACSGQDGLRSLAVAQAIIRSTRDGRRISVAEASCGGDMTVERNGLNQHVIQ
jgi:1,5-anhydro-D-fructose reductase (1,5-anhydro-D-mannitol-forming)